MKDENKQWWKRLYENSYLLSLIITIITFIVIIMFINIVLYNDEMSVKFREYSLTLIISIVVGFFIFVLSRINKLIELLNSKENLINKIEKYVDNRILKFYNSMLDKLKASKDLNKFTDFIVEITAEHVFKNPLPTLAEIENSEYKKIIEAAIENSSKKSFNATLTDYLPDWFFDKTVGNSDIPVAKRKSYLNSMNELNYRSKRLMVFKEDELRESFNKMTKSNKEKFFGYHKKVELFWITKEDFNSQIDIDGDIDSIPDCAIIDNKLGLQKEGKVLKMIFGKSIQDLITIFKKLEGDKKSKIINTKESPFKDKQYIISTFKDNYKKDEDE